MGIETFRLWAGASALCLALAGCGQQSATAPTPSAVETTLIPRVALFADADRSGALLAPRGDRVAFLAPRDGVNNLWVMAVGAMDEVRPVTAETERGVSAFVWAQDSATLLYLRDEAGDGTTRLYSVGAAGGTAPLALTPAGVRAEIVGMSANDPGGVVVALYLRDPTWPDLYRVDIATGARTLLERNPGGFTRYVLDRTGRVRLATRPTDDGGAQMMARANNGRWTPLFDIPSEDAMSAAPVAFAADGQSFLMLDSTGRDRAALVRVDAQSGAKTVLGESARADVSDVWLDPATNTPHAFAAAYLRPEWRALDSEAQSDLDLLSHQLTGDFHVTSRSADDARWIVVEEGPTTPARTYLYERGDRDHRRLSLLFRNRPGLEQAPLQPMTPVEIEARDGLTLVSYLTLPPGSDGDGDGRPDRPEPTVLLVHDGPWARDSYGFNELHQWLANRGYAVLSVNFRGSAGFGKAFLNAGNREWGGRMQEDLLDALQWAVRGGVAEADHIAIVGQGFGGYAALMGLALSPQEFRCGASLNGFTNLPVFLDSLPAPLRAQRNIFLQRVGDVRTAEGRQGLRDHSPLFHAGQIRDPLLLALGARAAGVSRAEADQISFAVRARGAGLTYIVFPEEGAHLQRTPDRLAFLAVLEHFLGDCMGGRVQAVGSAFDGASLVAYEGAVNVPGLSAFARRLAAPAPALEDVAPLEVAPIAEAPAIAAPTAEPQPQPTP